jgi:signal transduction histidine kinase
VARDIRIWLEPAGQNNYWLVVEDDGVGCTGAGELKGTGLGSRSIHAMAAGLRSSVTYDPSHAGTRAVMELEIQGDEDL